MTLLQQIHIKAVVKAYLALDNNHVWRFAFWRTVGNLMGRMRRKKGKPFD